MKLIAEDLVVTSFETVASPAAASEESTPECPTPMTFCFVCPVSKYTECEQCEPTPMTICFICPPLSYDCPKE